MARGTGQRAEQAHQLPLVSVSIIIMPAAIVRVVSVHLLLVLLLARVIVSGVIAGRMRVLGDLGLPVAFHRLFG